MILAVPHLLGTTPCSYSLLKYDGLTKTTMIAMDGAHSVFLYNVSFFRNSLVTVYKDVHCNLRSRGDSASSSAHPVLNFQPTFIPFRCHPCQLFLVFTRREFRFESPSCNKHYSDNLTLFITGAGGIRTPGTFRHNGFQDRLLKPLGHRSN